jgi:hypothetical protein
MRILHHAAPHPDAEPADPSLEEGYLSLVHTGPSREAAA